MYCAYKSYLFFVNKVWPFSVKMLFWTSVCLCTRASIQLRNDAFCSWNWAHTEVLNLISSGKFNDICLLSYINWLNWFFLNLQKLDLTNLSFPGHSYFYYLSRISWFDRNFSALPKENLVEQTILVNSLW